MASKFVTMIQTIVFIIIAVLVSIIVLSYFKIDMKENDTIKTKISMDDQEIAKLNRFAIYEGHTGHTSINK